MPTNSRFVFMADVTGSPDEKGSFVGVASSCNPDRRKQMLSQKALGNMASQVPLALVVGATHEGAVVDIAAEVGKVESFYLEDGGNKLCFKGKLDPTHPHYEFWCSKLDPDNEFSFEYKTSIGGWVPTDAIQKAYKAGEMVEVLDAFRLDHLLFCRGDAAVNQDTAIARGMASPTDWQGAIFYAMAEAAESVPAEEVVAELPAGAAEVVSVDNQGGATPPEMYQLNSQVRFLLDRMLRSNADDEMPYIIGIYADGTVLYEVYCEGEYCTYLTKWAWDGTQITLTDPVEVMVEVEVKRTYKTPDGTPISVFNAAPIGTDDETNEEMLQGWAMTKNMNGTSVSTKPWSQVDKTQLPMECFLFVGDKAKKSTWKFPVYEKSGKLNINALDAAASRINSTTPEIKAKVLPKLKSQYKKLGKPLPPSLEGKADGGSDMADKRGFGSLLSAMAELFRDEGQTDDGTEEVAGMAEAGTVETETVADAAPATPELPAGLADVIAAAIADGFKALMPVVAAASEGETEVGAAEVVAETETEEAVASVEEPAAEGTGMAEADLEAAPAAEESAPVGMSQADLDALNGTMQKIWQAVEGIGARVGQLESVGMADGGSTQVAAPAPAAAPTQRKSLLQDFVCR